MRPLEYLETIKKRGHSCYIVGGYVRDRLLGIDSNDIDIATSATPKEIAEIFAVSSGDNLGCVRIVDYPYTLDITTYRLESSYEHRHPKTVEYITDIDVDLSRRDFTINAICLDENGNIYDPLGGVGDLKNKTIRVIGDIESKLIEDPLRILRALRFSIIYNFHIDDEAKKFIVENKDLLTSISYSKRKGEFDKILISGKGREGLKFLNDLKILNLLGIKLMDDYIETQDLIGAWAQLDCDGYPFSKVEKMRLANIKTIVKKGRIDYETLFLYGVYDNLVAGEILRISKSKILGIYNDMVIHNEEELALNGNQIIDILNIKSGPIIKDIKKDLLRQVLSGNLPNSESELSNYIRKNWK